MYYVYLLRSQIKQSQLYVGYTEDLELRLKKHNTGEVRSTKPYCPWELIYYEVFTSKKDAKQREQYLKTTKGRRMLRLMLQDTLSLKNKSFIVETPFGFVMPKADPPLAEKRSERSERVVKYPTPSAKIRNSNFCQKKNEPTPPSCQRQTGRRAGG